MTQTEALQILKTGANVFLTGEPGSGKSHTINDYVRYLRQNGVEPAITASTGIASTHIGGMTIHSWSGLGIKNKLTKYDLEKISTSEYLSKRIQKTKVLIIDEISMLSANSFSMIDQICREIKNSNEPFGGIQVVLVGDFFQLPPVIKSENKNPQNDLFEETPLLFAYDSPAWKSLNPIICYLSEQYRQDDDNFLDVLSAIRTNDFSEHHFEYIKLRQITDISNLPENTPKLFPHNLNVDQINNLELSKLTGNEHKYVMTGTGTPFIVETLKKGCLSPEILILKKGATVMFTKNNPKEGYVNGTLGVVVDFASFTNYPIVKIENGRRVTVEEAEWAMEENGKVKARIKQIPLRLAWAVTIHKSQGMSLDKALMDLSGVFEYGQGYVALSRVRRLSGLYLLGFNEKTFQVHPEVLEKDLLFKEESNNAEKTFSLISPSEIEKMHKNFIVASGGKWNTNPKIKPSKKQKIKTEDKTHELIKEGKNIYEISEIRNYVPGTILEHVDILVKNKKISPEELANLWPKDEKEVSNIKKIQEYLLKEETDFLKPIYEHFKGEYGYDLIRLAKILSTIFKV